MNNFHTPVLLKEVIENLRVEKGKKYIDATIGGGGHAFEILERGGIVLGIDVDREAIEHIREEVGSQKSEVKNSKRLILVKGNFRDIDKIAHSKGFDKVSGIVFDLGVSSHQLEEGERGFSFLREGPLDMRMDQDLSIPAKDLINVLTKGELYELFSKLGEESNAWRISELIVSARKVKPIETTLDLVEIIKQAKPQRLSKINPATQVFQALRIAINDEINALKDGLPKALGLLENRGRLITISFHSLDDRVVKQSFVRFKNENRGEIITAKPITPNGEEIDRNIRSRSAKLRVLEKI